MNSSDETATEYSVVEPQKRGTPPENSTSVRLAPLQLSNHPLGIASAASAALATLLTIVLIFWIVALLVSKRHRPIKWRPQPPPRGNIQLQVPLPPPSDGYIKPRCIPKDLSSLSTACSTSPEREPPERSTGHTYLLLLDDDAQISKRTSTKQYVNSHISLPFVTFDEPGYLTMRKYPTVLKIPQCGDDMINYDAIKDHLYNYARGDRTLHQTSPSRVDETNDNGYQEMASVKDTTFPLSDVLQPSPTCYEEYVLPSSLCKQIAGSTSKREKAYRNVVNDIQNRILPSPPSQNSSLTFSKKPLQQKNSTASDQVLIS